MDADNDKVIIKRKSWHKEWCSHHWKPDFISTYRECSSRDVMSVQMVLAASWVSFFDCYVQRMSIQNELLKSIKYSTFEVSVLKEIVDKNRLWKARSEHFWDWFYKTFGLDLRVQMYRDLLVSLYKLTGKKGYCGNHWEGNKEMILHSDFDHR